VSNSCISLASKLPRQFFKKGVLLKLCLLSHGINPPEQSVDRPQTTSALRSFLLCWLSYGFAETV